MTASLASQLVTMNTAKIPEVKLSATSFQNVNTFNYSYCIRNGAMGSLVRDYGMENGGISTKQLRVVDSESGALSDVEEARMQMERLLEGADKGANCAAMLLPAWAAEDQQLSTGK